MVRSAWVKPMTLVQKFEANEAVANNCFLIACESKATNSTGSGAPGDLWNEGEGYYSAYDSPFQTGPNKHPSFKHENCGTASNNVFNINGGSIEFVQEIGGADGLHGVDGWSDEDHNDVISDGDIVYWHSSNLSGPWSAGTRWNHWGTVTAVDPNYPNRS